MKFPSISAERLHAVELGVHHLTEKVGELERYATVIPNKRSANRNGSLPKSAVSDTSKLHVVVADVEFDLLTGTGAAV